MPEFSPMTFLEVWDKTVEKHSNEIFLIFENSDGIMEILPRKSPKRQVY